MSENAITDSGDMSAALPPQDNTPTQDKVSQDQKNLAKIGNSPDWTIISKYLDARIEVYKNGLFGENLAGQDTTIIGQRFLAAQSVIQEFEALKTEIEVNTKAVNDAVGKDNLEIAKDPATKKE